MTNRTPKGATLLRTGHGNGRGTPRVELPKWAEARPAPDGVAAPPGVERDPLGRVATPAAARLLAQKPRRKGFLPAAYQADPRFESFDRGRLEWLAAQRADYCTRFGQVSVAVDALLTNAGWEFSAGQFMNWIGATTGEADAFKSAAALSAAARSSLLASWELASREAASRPKANSMVALKARLAAVDLGPLPTPPKPEGSE